MLYELTIQNDGDASSGVYGTYEAARAAADEAARVDGLTARLGGYATVGPDIVEAHGDFVDPTDDVALWWFTWTIRRLAGDKR